LSIILPVLKHGLDLINDSKADIKNDHGKIQASYNDHQCPHDHSKSKILLILQLSEFNQIESNF
jgi:hypothetical protein